MKIPMFIIPIIVWAITQVIKLIIDRANWEHFSFDRLFIAWWFPSVHSALSTSLLVTIWYTEGIYSSVFAMTLIFSMLFWYDAANVRYQAWNHAQIINKMRNQLSSIFKLEYSTYISSEKLKERLWHTFQEVIWWIIMSCILTTAVIYLFNYYSIHIK